MWARRFVGVSAAALRRRTSRRLRGSAAGVAFVLLATGTAVSGLPSPAGPEFTVNVLAGNQFRSGVAMAPGGEFVAVWEHDCSIKARRYDAAGQPLDDTEFQVPNYIPSCAFAPNVATDPSGDFVVVWTSSGSEGSDSDEESIQARRFSSDGTPDGPQFQVNTYTTGDQRTPTVAADAAGNFVIAWTSRQGGYPYQYVNGYQARRFTANGTPIGEDFQVNSLVGSEIEYSRPGLAVAAGGEFAVVWAGPSSAGTDRDSYSIQARRYDSEGVPVGPQFQVNTFTTGFQFSPRAAIDGQGRLLVVWASDVPGGNSIRARRIDFPTSPSDVAEFQDNADTSYLVDWPSVAVDPAGGFVVVWTGFDGDGSGIRGRQFRPDATPVGDDFQINSYTSSPQSLPTVATDHLGNFVVTWTSIETSPHDDDVRARRFDALFRDGFESSDTGRWSVSVP
jgi:hypothetical protein